MICLTQIFLYVPGYLNSILKKKSCRCSSLSCHPCLWTFGSSTAQAELGILQVWMGWPWGDPGKGGTSQFLLWGFPLGFLSQQGRCLHVSRGSSGSACLGWDAETPPESVPLPWRTGVNKLRGFQLDSWDWQKWDVMGCCGFLQFSLLRLIFSHPSFVVAPHTRTAKAELKGYVGELCKLVQYQFNKDKSLLQSCVSKSVTSCRFLQSSYKA